ncbi:MAG: hydroxyacid dehydrogenase [Oscillospiraceae bacterium]|nr:hydroxyacid dehydrogenase [Oscillospiraceae bacterium]MBQ5342773.1 hydroxyacid dehydrogenase [Oscillospiraceae bacterium]
MKIAVLDSSTLGDDLDLSPLMDDGNEVKVYYNTSNEQIPEHLQGCEVAVINKVKLRGETLCRCGSLRLICVAATGYDNVDIEYCRKNGIAVCNVVGYSTDSVAQLTAAMVLYLADHLPEYTEAVRSGDYTEGGVANMLVPVVHELAGKTWGIAGYGNIGRKVGTIAKALGCRVIVYKREPVEDADCVTIEELCSRSDILTVHLPLNDGTRGLFSAEMIALLKKDCIFVNVARGAVTDEEALAEALEEGRIAGLGVDVYSQEPFPQTHPFYRIKGRDNVCLTPHMAWGSYEARKRCLADIVESIRSFRDGGTRSRVV